MIEFFLNDPEWIVKVTYFVQNKPFGYLFCETCLILWDFRFLKLPSKPPHCMYIISIRGRHVRNLGTHGWNPPKFQKYGLRWVPGSRQIQPTPDFDHIFFRPKTENWYNPIPGAWNSDVHLQAWIIFKLP